MAPGKAAYERVRSTSGRHVKQLKFCNSRDIQIEKGSLFCRSRRLLYLLQDDARKNDGPVKMQHAERIAIGAKRRAAIV